MSYFEVQPVIMMIAMLVHQSNKAVTSLAVPQLRQIDAGF